MLGYKALRVANIKSIYGKNNWGGADEERRLLKEYHRRSVSSEAVPQTSKEVVDVLEAILVNVVGKEDDEKKSNSSSSSSSSSTSSSSSAVILHEPVALVLRSKV